MMGREGSEFGGKGSISGRDTRRRVKGATGEQEARERGETEQGEEE